MNKAIGKTIETITDDDIRTALQTFQRKLNYTAAVYLHSCVHCGLCAESCHYYLTDGELKSLPAYKLDLIARIFKRYYGISGKIIPNWIGAKDLNRELLEEWIDVLYGRCTMCGRCSINCSIGIHIASLIRVARGILSSIDVIPPGLDSTVRTAIEKGNNMGVPAEEWVATVDWLQEELQDELGITDVKIPIDKKGARLLYIINPREASLFPMSISAAARIFYAAGENWTLSSESFDVTNYGLFIGDETVGSLIAGRMVEAMKKLECQILVLSECGHGYNSGRWESPEWRKQTHPFEVKSFLEILAGYIRDRKIKLDPSKNQEIVTLHDPCNLVRYGGIIEEQRYILKHAVTNFIEMTPNRQKNYCCGGGGGQLNMSHYKDRRIKAGKLKADQIKKTSAKIVAAPCHNCIDQLLELNKHYKLGIEIKTIAEIVANALVL